MNFKTFNFRLNFRNVEKINEIFSLTVFISKIGDYINLRIKLHKSGKFSKSLTTSVLSVRVFSILLSSLKNF